MDENELKTRFPRASKDFINANIELRPEVVERVAWSSLVVPAQRKAKSDERISVRYVLYRVRLLDPDNAFGATKTITDCLCQIGILPGDAADQISLQVEQEKVNHRNEERTELHIKYP